MPGLQRVVRLFSMCALACAALFAQSDTGAISGAVTDPNGAVVPGAAVRAVHQQTGREVQTVTTEAGVYAFPSLTPGAYTITIEKPGFKRHVQSGVELRVA